MFTRSFILLSKWSQKEQACKKTEFPRIYLSRRSSHFHWNITSIRKTPISSGFVGLFKLQLYKCVCSWPSRVLNNWKHSLSTAQHFSPFLIRQTVVAQTPHWDISLRYFSPPISLHTGLGKGGMLQFPPYNRVLAPHRWGREDVLTGYSFAWSGINQKEAI